MVTHSPAGKTKAVAAGSLRPGLFLSSSEHSRPLESLPLPVQILGVELPDDVEAPPEGSAYDRGSPGLGQNLGDPEGRWGDLRRNAPMPLLDKTTWRGTFKLHPHMRAPVPSVCTGW